MNKRMKNKRSHSLNRKHMLSGGIIMKKVLMAILVGSLCVAFAGNASAFNGKRSGFILGFGLGLGNTSITKQDFGYYPFGGSGLETSNSYSAINTDFRIGGGPSDQVHIYYVSKVGFYTENDNLSAQGLGGLGATYYLNKTAPSVYFTAAYGLTTLTTVESSGGGEIDMGSGFAIGAGYEFVAHLSIEANLIKGSLGDESSASSFRVTLNALAF